MKNNEKKEPIKFGDISSPGGAIYVVRAENAFEDMTFSIFEFLKAATVKEGIPLVPEVIEALKARAKEEAQKTIDQARAQGVPQVFRQMFEVSKKKDVERFCKSMIIEHKDFALLCGNIDQIGYEHKRHHSQIVPNDLKPTEEERKAFFGNGLGTFKNKAAAKFIQKIIAGFKKRKNINAHLFQRGTEWHIFWFTYDDLNAGAKGEKPHWKAGDHIHYTSHLWGHDMGAIWKQLIDGKYSIAGAHIRYSDQSRKG